MFAKKRKDKETTGSKTYEFKLRTNIKFVRRCEEVLTSCYYLYNNALEHRISVYQYTGKGVSYFDQQNELKEIRRVMPEAKDILCNIQRDVLQRVQKTYDAFYRRCAEKKAETRKGKVGFPRFKAAHRYNSFSQTIEKVRGCPLDGDKLTVPGVGTVRVRLSRPITGTVKELRIIRKPNGWYTQLVCAVPKCEPLPKTGLTTGVDVNIENTATLSDGTVFPNPRITKNNAKKLKQAQRDLARKEKGSANRSKGRVRVQRVHQHIGNARRDHAHKNSTYLVRHYDIIIFEAIAILNLVKNGNFAKHILDVGWGLLRDLTASKALNADREVGWRNPAYTSQTCSRCGHRQPMPLSERTFTCERCHLVLPRDWNAAINIGQGMPKFTPVERRPLPERPSSRKSPCLKQEQEREDKSDRRNRTLQLDLFAHP